MLLRVTLQVFKLGFSCLPAESAHPHFDPPFHFFTSLLAHPHRGFGIRPPDEVSIGRGEGHSVTRKSGSVDDGGGVF
jgi:hypothetical protein